MSGSRPPLPDRALRMSRGASTGDPGSALLREVRDHWQVSEETARAILRRHGIPTVGEGRPRYRWRDIWRVEREPWVPPWDWPAFRAPLLCPTDLPALDPHGRSGRTFRRLLATGRIPSIELSPGIRRIRPQVFDQVIGHV
jgi:hypothetical protein